MARKPETIFRGRLRKLLDKIPNAWFESIQQKTIQGTPDILGCVNGHFVGLELKASPQHVPSPLQEHKLKLIAAAGGMAFVVNPVNAQETINLLMELSKDAETNLETNKCA